MPNATYLNATDASGRAFYMAFHSKGPIIMINLLRYRSVADYADYPELAPEQEVTGEAAYELYMKATQQHLEKAGSKVLYFGDCTSFLIGPEDEQWDAVLLVKHVSVTQFMAFAQNEVYLKTAGHRAAALSDSRLLPMQSRALPWEESV
ncbi:MAG: DUF1330 domain-containing protein [Salibacteraceae bacterium]